MPKLIGWQIDQSKQEKNGIILAGLDIKDYEQESFYRIIGWSG